MFFVATGADVILVISDHYFQMTIIHNAAPSHFAADQGLMKSGGVGGIGASRPFLNSGFRFVR